MVPSEPRPPQGQSNSVEPAVKQQAGAGKRVNRLNTGWARGGGGGTALRPCRLSTQPSAVRTS